MIATSFFYRLASYLQVHVTRTGIISRWHLILGLIQLLTLELHVLERKKKKKKKKKKCLYTYHGKMLFRWKPLNYLSDPHYTQTWNLEVQIWTLSVIWLWSHAPLEYTIFFLCIYNVFHRLSFTISKMYICKASWPILIKFYV